jgi:signal peptidase
MRIARLLLRLVVVLGAAALTVSLAVPVWFVLHDQRLLVITTRSMEPVLAPGDVAVLQRLPSASDLHAGLLVAYLPPDSDRLVTHRVLATRALPRTRTDPATGQVREVLDAFGRPALSSWLITKGDANPDVDPDAVPLSSVRGVVVAVHHGVGAELTRATSPLTRTAIAIPVLLALGALELADRRSSGRVVAGRRAS